MSGAAELRLWVRKTREEREDRDREKREKFDGGGLLLGQLGRNLNNSFKPTYVVEFFFFLRREFFLLDCVCNVRHIKKISQPNQSFDFQQTRLMFKILGTAWLKCVLCTESDGILSRGNF